MEQFLSYFIYDLEYLLRMLIAALCGGIECRLYGRRIVGDTVADRAECGDIKDIGHDKSSLR